LDGAQDLFGTVDRITMVTETPPQFDVQFLELLFEAAHVVLEYLRDGDRLRRRLSGIDVGLGFDISGETNGRGWHDILLA
jgi:hypothetical protein